MAVANFFALSPIAPCCSQFRMVEPNKCDESNQAWIRGDDWEKQ